MEYFAEFGLFFAKFAVVIVVLLAGALTVIMFIARAKHAEHEQIEVKNLNKKFESMEFILKSSVLPHKQFKKVVKAARKEEKQRSDESKRSRVFVCRFKGDIRASAVASLREEITAILTIARPEDEVVAIIESAGGTVHGYGLAASQLQRVKEKNVPLTAAVDKIAASGGYMIACVADRIIAAPFAIVGSIGVIAQLPNFNRLLRKHDVDFEQITAGRYKRTLTLFGENTDDDRRKFQEEIDDTHELFKEFVHEHRPQVDLAVIGSGEHWFGRRAVAKNLIDELRTSDDYLSARARDADIYEVGYALKKHWFEKFFTSVQESLANL